MKGIRSIIFALTLVLIGAVVCAGCISLDTNRNDTKYQETLEGTWVLEGNEKVTISFGEGVGGQAPINLYSGSYTVYGDELTFGEGFITTLMAGSDEMMKAEKEFFAALHSTAGWKIVDGNLVLTDIAGETLLTFIPSVLGKWDGKSGSSIIFNADGTFNGHAFINSFGGSYTAGDGTLTLEHTYVTEMAGSPEDMKAEDAFFESLSKVTGFTIRGDKLTLTDAEGKDLLYFVRHITLSGEWVLEDNSYVKITFEDDRLIRGQAPINGFVGSYSTSGNSIFFGDDMVQTMMGASPELMEAESEFMKALGATTQFFFLDGELLFTDQHGEVLLTFERPTLE